MALIKTQWEGASDEALIQAELATPCWHGLEFCIAAGIFIDAAHTVGAINRMAVMPNTTPMDLINFRCICSPGGDRHHPGKRAAFYPHF